MRDTRGVKATGLQGDTSAEIIEIIDDDIDVFGDRASHTTIADSGGPRWVGPVAAVALVALIGYGVATSASTSGAPKVAPVTSSTVAPTTTEPAPTTIVPEPLVPYYAADPPREYTVDYAEIQDGIGSTSSFFPGGYELWATPGATATSGSWFSIESYPGGNSFIYATDAYRVQTDNQSIALSHTAFGQTIAQFSPSRSSSGTLTAFGLTDEEVVRLAESVSDDRPFELTDPTLLTGYQLLSSVQPWFAVQGIPVEQIFYADSTNALNGIGISVALRPPASEGGSTLDRQIALRFFLDHATPFGVDGHVAVAGSIIGQTFGQGDYSIATWIAGDHIVTVTGTMPVPELISIARSVHQVSADEWQGMKFQASRNTGNDTFGAFDSTVSTPVSFGTDAEAKPWTIRASVATFGDQQQVNWEWSGNGFGMQLDGTAKINTVVENERTYVLADLPRAIATAARLQVTRVGLDPVVVQFADTDPSLDRTFAAYAFSEAAPYTAAIIGPDGAVLATWPSS